jgi:pimeloyl-ACP methyl ester carboxylesterase
VVLGIRAVSIRPWSGRPRVSLIVGAVCCTLAATACGPALTPPSATFGTAGPVSSPSHAPAAVSSADPTPPSDGATLARTAAQKTGPAPAAAIEPELATRRPTGTDIRIVPAAGVRQWLNCQGTGKVTVVVITGLASTASGWSRVSSQFRGITRTCFYDRPGLGYSPARPNPRQVLDAGLYARELQLLLLAAGESGPYLILGHSFGGLVARAFAYRYPLVVRGVLLAESVDPRTTTGPYWQEGGHNINMALSKAATGGGPALGTKPLLVVSALLPDRDRLGGPTYGEPSWLTQQWISEQRADTRLSKDSIQVIARSGHVLQLDDPAAVVEAVRLEVHAVVTGRQLVCSRVWSLVQATCRT